VFSPERVAGAYPRPAAMSASNSRSSSSRLNPNLEMASSSEIQFRCLLRADPPPDPRRDLARRQQNQKYS
jgi:hypothetical protein